MNQNRCAASSEPRFFIRNRPPRSKGLERLESDAKLLSVPGCSITLGIGLFTAFKATLLGCPVPSLSLEVVDASFGVHPHNGVVGTTTLGRLFSLKMSLRIRSRRVREREQKYEGRKDN